MDPFACKVEQLQLGLAAHAEVRVVYDESFRTNKSALEGTAFCKNALIVGRRRGPGEAPPKEAEEGGVAGAGTSGDATAGPSAAAEAGVKRRERALPEAQQGSGWETSLRVKRIDEFGRFLA